MTITQSPDIETLDKMAARLLKLSQQPSDRPELTIAARNAFRAIAAAMVEIEKVEALTSDY